MNAVWCVKLFGYTHTLHPCQPSILGPWRSPSIPPSDLSWLTRLLWHCAAHHSQRSTASWLLMSVSERCSWGHDIGSHDVMGVYCCPLVCETWITPKEASLHCGRQADERMTDLIIATFLGSAAFRVPPGLCLSQEHLLCSVALSRLIVFLSSPPTLLSNSP